MPVFKQNQSVRSRNPKDFPALLLKILPAALVVVGLEACHSTSVSANTSSLQAPVVAPAGSVLRVRLDQPLDTKHSRPGDRFSGVLDTALVADGKEILAKGTIVSGHVLAAQEARGLERPAVLSLVLDSCRVNGREVALVTDRVTRVSARRPQRNWPGASGGLGLGALGGIPEANPSSAPGGAVRGDAARTGSVANADVFVPAQTVVGFTLRSPLAV